MITILTTTNHKNEVEQTIKSVDRLEELVSISTENTNDLNLLIVEDNCITKPLDWFDMQPPFILPKVEFTQNNLLAFVFYALGNHQKAFEYLTEDTEVYNNILAATNIQFGYEISEDLYQSINNSKHNLCVVHQYGNYENRFQISELMQAYEDAINSAVDIELKAFSAKHYINLLIDIQQYDKAETLAKSMLENQLSDEAKNALKVQLATAMMQQLKVPFNTEALSQISTLFEEAISFYEAKNLKIQAGLLLIDASEIANYKEDFILSKDYINKAILYFKEADIPEFLGEASLRKATLLYTWSKNGQPQYYKAAINAYQDTLKVFKRDTHPDKFAEIHHNMALIYSEIPVSPEEKPMWTAFCASSFKEALAYFTKEQFPYEYAMISHNYATALINFPEAKLHSNFEKANGLFNEALSVRTAENFPFERASTLINQVELYWLLNNENSKDEIEKINQMKSKLDEVKQLTTDASMLEKVAFHEEKIESLKSVL